jgi:hypothetical protein
MMFSAFACDSITVPSCVAHNTGKGDKDRAMLTVLIKSLYRALEDNDNPNGNALPADVIKAIDALKPNFAQANREVRDGSFLVDPELAFEIPTVGISAFEWIRQLSASLVWSVRGEFDPSIRWADALVWNSMYIQGPAQLEVKNAAALMVMNQLAEWNLESFDWKGGWSAFPRSYPRDIYNFSVCFSPTLVRQIENEVAFRHQFYSRLNWYIWFAPSTETRGLLEAAAASLNVGQA